MLYKRFLPIRFFIFLFVFALLTFSLVKKANAALVGDVNGDGKVDIVDIGVIIDNYGKTPVVNKAADINNDGVVDIIDIGLTIDNYGKNSVSPTATPVVSGGSDYLFINRADLLNLPTNSAGWNALKADADASAGTPDLCNQDNLSHPRTTFAAALVYARTGDINYYNKAKSLILAAPPTLKYGCGNAILSLGRQLAAYVFEADLIKLNDPGFNQWLSNVRTYNTGNHCPWCILRETARQSANNWGIHSLTSLIAADRYLGDKNMVDEDWKIFSSYGVAFGWPFTKTADYNETWSCVPTNPSNSSKLPIAINTPCVKNGVNIDGAPVEDSSRTAFPNIANYPSEAIQGYTVQALLLSRAGYDAWNVNNQQVKRVQLFRERVGKIGQSGGFNYWNVEKFVNWVTNKVYGLNQPTVPAGFGRNFGYTDWLFGGK